LHKQVATLHISDMRNNWVQVQCTNHHRERFSRRCLTSFITIDEQIKPVIVPTKTALFEDFPFFQINFYEPWTRTWLVNKVKYMLPYNESYDPWPLLKWPIRSLFLFYKIKCLRVNTSSGILGENTVKPGCA